MISRQPDVIVSIWWQYDGDVMAADARCFRCSQCVCFMVVCWLFSTLRGVCVFGLVRWVRLVHVPHDTHGKANLSKVNQIINPAWVQPPVRVSLPSCSFGHFYYNAELLSSYWRADTVRLLSALFMATERQHIFHLCSKFCNFAILQFCNFAIY